MTLVKLVAEYHRGQTLIPAGMILNVDDREADRLIRHGLAVPERPPRQDREGTR